METEQGVTFTIKKKVIHRIFSDDYYHIRAIPRVFIFDSCDGEAEFSRDWRPEYSDNSIPCNDSGIRFLMLAGRYARSADTITNPCHQLFVHAARAPSFFLGERSISFLRCVRCVCTQECLAPFRRVVGGPVYNTDCFVFASPVQHSPCPFRPPSY